MVRVSILTSIIVVATLFSADAGDQLGGYSIDSSDFGSSRIFEGRQTGRFLWSSLLPFCTPIQKAVDDRKGGDAITLIFSDDDQGNFYTTDCGRVCTLQNESAAVNRCGSQSHMASCKLFAAIADGVIYDLTVSASSLTLEEVCSDK